MKLLSLKYVVLRYLVATILISLAGIGSDPAGIWILIPIAIVSLKFLIYDASIAGIRAKFPALKVKPWLLIGYTLAVAGDMFFTYQANSDEVDAGFAFFGTFMVTPWVLGITLLVMATATYRGRNKKPIVPRP